MTVETKRVALTWREGMIFSGGEPGGATALVDADNTTAPGPMLQLLLAAGSCTAADVLLILRKMQAPPRAFSMEVAGTRRDEHPRRYTAIHFTYRLSGEGIDEPRARRAIDLSLEKYCSV
ncbi:MAG: OsmC family protein, partial [Gemmatimonadales bacterium]|nr:OsmC family protein [Gemmatimonadales bacterium]